MKIPVVTSPADLNHTFRLGICLSVSIVFLLVGCGGKEKSLPAPDTLTGVAITPSLSTAPSAANVKVTTPTLNSISVTPSSASFAIGGSTTLSATGIYSDDTSSDISRLVTWKSNSKNIVTISKVGIATGKNFGAGSITAQLNGKVSGAATVSVAPTVGGRLSGLAIGNSITLTNNGVDKITLTTNGSFAFPAVLTTGSSYKLAIAAFPNRQPCTHTYGAGKVKLANVTSLDVICGMAPRGEMTASDSLGTARRDHTSTLLADGKVLLAGGVGATGSLASAELYDPVAGHWTVASNLTTARRDHTATLLPDGKVLVAGGIGDGVARLSSAEIYDPATGLWRVTGSLSLARRDHTSTLLFDGKILLVGGIGAAGMGILASVELYDPDTGRWGAVRSLATARTQHTATLLPDGKVLVAGGMSATGSVSSTESYDPDTGLWSTAGNLAVTRHLHTATLLPDGKVLVAGGLNEKGNLDSTELYDPSTGLWSSTGSLVSKRYSHTAILLPTGKVLVTGGIGATGSAALAGAELYDPRTGIWVETGSLSTPRSQHTTTLLSNGKAFVTGGNDGAGILKSTELYW